MARATSAGALIIPGGKLNSVPTTTIIRPDPTASQIELTPIPNLWYSS